MNHAFTVGFIVVTMVVIVTVAYLLSNDKKSNKKTQNV